MKKNTALTTGLILTLMAGPTLAATQSNGTGWNGASLNGTGWNGVSLNGTGWNGTGWNGTGWNGTGWNGTATTGTSAPKQSKVTAVTLPDGRIMRLSK